MPKVRLWTFSSGKTERDLCYKSRTNEEVRNILIEAQKKDRLPTIVLFPRADGFGSSQDLPEFQAILFQFPFVEPNLADPAWEWSQNSLRTPGACIGGIPITFKMMPAEDPEAIEYFTPDFLPNLRKTGGEVVPAKTENFVNAIFYHFGLKGTRMEADPMPSVVRGTGLGGSNLAHIAAVAFASALSGVNLILSQIYGLATNLETNFTAQLDESGKIKNFGISITGGQEGLTALQGGFWDNVHMPHLGLFSVFSREIVLPEKYKELEERSFLVNVGKEQGHKRKSSDVNAVWMSKFHTYHGTLLHKWKIKTAYLGVEGLRLGDHQQVVDALGNYADIRATLCPEYYLGNEEIIQKAEEVGAAWFFLGAGGPKSTAWIYGTDPKGIAQIKKYFEDTANPEIGRVVIPFKIEPNGGQFINFEENGFEVPTPPEEMVI